MRWPWKEEDPLNGELEKLSDQIRVLTGEVAKLQGQRDSGREVIELQDTVKTLKEEVTNLEIKRSKERETNEREKRETQHEVGLLRKQQEWERQKQEEETELAIEEARVEVREKNLEQEKELLNDRIKFMEERFNEEVGYIHDLMEKILERLPTVSMERTVRENYNGQDREGAEDESDET